MKYVALLLFALAFPQLSFSDDCCDCRCERCGCQAHCEKVCRVVCEMKDIKVTCYCCKEEDICIPGPSKKCGEVCEPNPCGLAHPAECDACAGGPCGDGGCDHCHKHSFLDCIFGNNCCEKRTLWQPACSGDARTVNKLIKYEVSKKVPTYKWVVEYRCDKCRCDSHDDLQIPPATPAAPKQAAAQMQQQDVRIDMAPAKLPMAAETARAVGSDATQSTAALVDAPWYRLEQR